MTISQPSSLIYNVDVPEIKSFSAKFQYNFFEENETISDVPAGLSSLVDFNKQFVGRDLAKLVELKSPRNVYFTWTNPSITKNVGLLQSTQTDINIIERNFSKIISEDELSTFRFATLSLNDSEVDKKAFNAISSSFEIQSIDYSVNKNTSAQNTALQLSDILKKSHTNEAFIKAIMSQDNSVSFVNGAGVIKNFLLENVKSFSISSQLNTTLMSDIIAETMENSFSQYNTALFQLKNMADQLKNNNNITLNVDEFMTTIPALELNSIDKALNVSNDETSAQLVGFIIRKYEVDDDDNLVEQAPIIIENPLAANAYDFSVKYGFQYVYTIESVALYKLQALDSVSLQPSIVKFLVTSRPSAKIKIECIETTAPPPPSDIKLTWNYQNDELHVAWAFPSNPQRDIQKFQIFRRASIEEPFELLKEYDFNRASIQVDFENVPSDFTQKLTSPLTYYVDDEFKKSSKFIYTVCAIDAHGYTSNYGAQFQATFDIYKNQLKTKLISHSGAPKQYPNLFVENEIFVDTIKVSSANKIKLYLSPTCFNVINQDENKEKMLKFEQDGARYKLSLLNLDNQIPAEIEISVDDKLDK